MKQCWFTRAVLLCLVAAGARAEIVDRIAVIAGNRIIKQSDINEDIRIAAFLNQEKADFSAAEQKKAVNRLIDQALIRSDIANGVYVDPDPSEAAKLFDQVKQRAGGEAAFRKQLANYGITEQALKDRLQWQTQVLKFVEARFGTEQSGGQVNQQFFKWLDETRNRTRIVYKDEGLK